MPRSAWSIALPALMAFLIFPVLRPIPQKGSAVEVWYPRSRAVIVHTGMAAVVGAFEDDIASIQLLRVEKTATSISLQGHEQKEAFAKKIRDLFPSGSFLKSIELTFLLGRGKTEIRNFDAGLEDPVDLRQFWASPFFKDVYSIAYQKSTLGAQVRIALWSGPLLPVGNAEYRERYMNKFAFSPALDAGVNTFYFRVLDGAGATRELDSLRFFMESDAAAESSAGFIEEPLHSEEQEEFCGGCHEMRPSDEVVQNRGDVKAVCSTCHTPLVSQASSHFPAAEWDCLSCHDGNSSPRYALYADQSYDAEFCLQCHGDIQELFEKKVPHAAAQMNCINCHDPHGSTRRKLLKAEVQPLCAACHEETANTPHPVDKHPLTGDRDPLVSERRFSCASCHDPHGSDNKKLVREPFGKMCRECHDVR